MIYHLIPSEDPKDGKMSTLCGMSVSMYNINILKVFLYVGYNRFLGHKKPEDIIGPQHNFCAICTEHPKVTMAQLDELDL